MERMEEQEWTIREDTDAVHVVPIPDVRAHSGWSCPCKPEISLGDNEYDYVTPIITHNSFRDIDIVEQAVTQLFNERLPSS
jgi:hypothetical protein